MTQFLAPPADPLFHPGYRSGAYYCAMSSGTAVTTGAVAADTIYHFPIVIHRPARVKGIAIRVGVAVPATNVKLGIASGETAAAKTLLSAAASAGDMNSVANTTISLDLPAVLPLTPGVYWGLALFNGAAQPYTLGNVPANHGLAEYLGGPSMATYTTFVGAAQLTVAQSYASGFPSSISAPSVATSMVIPMLGWYHE